MQECLTYSCEERSVKPVQEEPEHHGRRGEGVDESWTNQKLELGALIGGKLQLWLLIGKCAPVT